MLEHALDELGKRGYEESTVVSGNTLDSSRRYSSNAVSRIGFHESVTPNRKSRDERLDRVTDSARGVTGLLDWQDPAWAVINAVAGTDGVLIAGGGNLNSTWPEHIYERVAIARLAQIFNKPLVISGQTFGPLLLGRDGDLLAELLAIAALIGVRENPSFELALKLGVDAGRLRLNVDDAHFLASASDSDIPPMLSELVSGPYAAATFAPYSGSELYETHLARITSFTDLVAKITGLPVLLLPHEGFLDTATRSSDIAIHDQIAERSAGTQILPAPVLPAKVVARLTRGASFVVSSRYHPIVFAQSGYVPSIGISVDTYTDIKISGALRQAGMSNSIISAAALGTSDCRHLLQETWKTREEIRGQVMASSETCNLASTTWWDDVAATIGGHPRATHTPASEPIQMILGSKEARERLNALRDLTNRMSLQNQRKELAWGEELERVRELVDGTAQAELRAGQAHADMLDALQRTLDVEAALRAAHVLLSSELDLIMPVQANDAADSLATAELARLHSTKLFRWTLKLRDFYSFVRGGRRRNRNT